MRLLAATTTHKVALFAILLLGVSVWVIVLLLLLELTRQLLDTMRFIVELGGMQ